MNCERPRYPNLVTVYKYKYNELTAINELYIFVIYISVLLTYLLTILHYIVFVLESTILYSSTGSKTYCIEIK